MFLLTHAATAEAVMAHSKLTPFQKDQLLIGSVLPDASELNIADERETHTGGLNFLNSLNKKYKYLGMGVILHGSSPKGLDYYTHNHFYDIGYKYVIPKTLTYHSGIIARTYERIKPYIRESSLRQLSDGDAAHFIVEFCFDHLTAKYNKHIGKRMTRALYNSVPNKSLELFADYFKITDKRFRRLSRVIQSNHWNKIFERFQTVEGTAHNLQHFMFIKSLREHAEKRSFIQTIRNFGRSSLDLLHTKLKDRSLVRLVDRCGTVLEPEYQPFLDQAVKNMKIMVKKNNIV